MTWGDIFQWLSEQLFCRDNGENEARWLVEAVVGLSFYSLREEDFDESLRPKLEIALAELAKGRPFQYVVGSQEFYGLSFVTREGVLVPRPETELLVESAIRWGEGRNLNVLDLCTGSGCIALSLAKHLQGNFAAVDISPNALSIAKENGARLELEVEWLEGDLFAPVVGEHFDLITANPPYLTEDEMMKIPVEVTYEPAIALVAGSDGLALCRRIIAEVDVYLNPGGLFLMEFGETQGQAVLDLMRPLGWSQVEIRQDYCGKDRFLYAVK